MNGLFWIRRCWAKAVPHPARNNTTSKYLKIFILFLDFRLHNLNLLGSPPLRGDGREALTYINKKCGRLLCRSHFCISARLLLGSGDSTRGAHVCASSAVDASIRVDAVDVAFGDGFRRAFGLACSASHAVVTNYVSHCSFCLFRLIYYVLFFAICGAKVMKLFMYATLFRIFFRVLIRIVKKVGIKFLYSCV